MKTPIFIDAKNTLFVAHRGLSALECENTLPAFIAAANRPYYGIETDVHVTADGKFVCIHNDDTEAVAADKLTVEKSSFDALRSLKLKDKDGTRGRIDLRIPTMGEYIKLCREYGKTAVLELKNRMPSEKIAEILSELAALGYLSGTTFISFNLENLLDIKRAIPSQSAQYLVSKYTPELLSVLTKNRLDLDIHHSALTKEIIDTLHENGVKINTWTVDSPDIARELIAWGVDQITSNVLCPLC